MKSRQLSWKVTLFVILMVAATGTAATRRQDVPEMILYATSTENGDSTIYTVEVANGSTTEVGVVKGFGSDVGWSPDGRYIYLVDYNESRQGTLTLVDTNTHSRQAVPETLALRWAHDGNFLAYLTQPEAQAFLRLLNPANGEVETLPDASSHFQWVKWSYDDRYLSYRLDSENSDNRLVIWDVQEQRLAAMLEMAVWADVPQWSPTDNRIVFTAAEPPLPTVYNPNDGSMQPLMGGAAVDWSPNGRYLTTYSPIESGFVRLSIFDTEADRPVEFDGDIANQPVDTNAVWSADGRYLAVAAVDVKDDYKRSVYVLDVEDGNSSRLAGDFYINQFVWSPVGNWLAFASNPDSYDGGTPMTTLWLFNVDRHSQQTFNLEMAASVYEPALNWSGDGQYMLIRTNAGHVFFYPGLNQIKPLVASIGYAQTARWALLETKLALTSLASASRDIYVFTPADGRLINVTNTPEVSETFLGWRGSTQRENLDISIVG